MNQQLKLMQQAGNEDEGYSAVTQAMHDVIRENVILKLKVIGLELLKKNFDNMRLESPSDINHYF